MMTREEAIDFGRASGLAALDQVREWGSLQNSIDNYRENLRDTLNDERASQHEAEAFAAFDAVVYKTPATVENLARAIHAALIRKRQA